MTLVLKAHSSFTELWKFLRNFHSSRGKIQDINHEILEEKSGTSASSLKKKRSLLVLRSSAKIESNILRHTKWVFFFFLRFCNSHYLRLFYHLTHLQKLESVNIPPCLPLFRIFMCCSELLARYRDLDNGKGFINLQAILCLFESFLLSQKVLFSNYNFD